MSQDRKIKNRLIQLLNDIKYQALSAFPLFLFQHVSWVPNFLSIAAAAHCIPMYVGANRVGIEMP